MSYKFTEPSAISSESSTTTPVAPFTESTGAVEADAAIVKSGYTPVTVILLPSAIVTVLSYKLVIPSAMSSESNTTTPTSPFTEATGAVEEAAVIVKSGYEPVTVILFPWVIVTVWSGAVFVTVFAVKSIPVPAVKLSCLPL